MKPSNPLSHPAHILLFDGVCHLCHGAVQFILQRDPTGQIHFASLQSEKGRELLAFYEYPQNEMQSVIFITNGKLYTKSDAVLRVGRKLNSAWPVLSRVALVIPRHFRDVVYDWIARNRYRWMGKAEQCMLPTPQIKSRFLE
ncbi:thiol-disulfide oxidoreductase DCC family protein [Brevibacillus sp. NRS-1366]|uniref:thiol-disulfide oxidoreductase DCC family protein n=1 Tax=Brevibacillus sp. NRS-1366 TaxID=3233899 RepID=UPI003D1B6BD3